MIALSKDLKELGKEFQLFKESISLQTEKERESVDNAIAALEDKLDRFNATIEQWTSEIAVEFENIGAKLEELETKQNEIVEAAKKTTKFSDFRSWL